MRTPYDPRGPIKAHPLYSKWKSMNKRTEDGRNSSYESVSVCERWRKVPKHRKSAEAFWNFVDDMGPFPSDTHTTLDRIDNSKDYSPSNCRWASMKDQAINRSSTVWITHNGETLHMKGWSEKLGIPYERLKARIYHNWSLERALTN